MVERFAAHLPLSADHEQLGTVGTRHAAALGLAERCDAVCIVVSEERGTRLDRARRARSRSSRARRISSPRCAICASPSRARARRGATPPPGARPASRVAIALALWLVFVPGSREIEVTLPARVVVERLPKEFRLEKVAPEEVEVTLTGRRRDLLLARRATSRRASTRCS